MAPHEMDAYANEGEGVYERQSVAATTTTTTKMDPAAGANTGSESIRISPQVQIEVEGAASSSPCQHKKTKKRLRWSTITVHEFGVGLGGSSVPSKGGPSVGLSDVPEFTWTTKVGEMAERSEGIHRLTSEERVRMLQAAGVSDGMILRFSRETNIILTSRKRTHLEDVEEKRAKKRRAEEAVALDRSCSAFLGRPRMIPANYV